MKKSVSLVALIVALPASVAFAADLPSKKEPVVAPVVVPMWSGFYAGLNAGYNWGTNSNQSGIAYVYGGDPVVPKPGAGASVSGPATVTQSGFIGGAQFGYNYQYGSRIVIGLETDISGTSTRGSQRSRGYASLNDGNSIGSTGVVGGLDYLGTVRGRVGYLWTPALLTYGTAGFAYGGAWGNVTQTAVRTQPGVAGSNMYSGYGQQNQLLTGWTAGAGAEWMFMPNWSVKAEALYWNLGNMNIATRGWGTEPNTTGYGRANINYQGVKAVAGVNYHFNFGAAPVVAKF